MPKVNIPPPFRGPTAGAAELEVAGSSVAECLDALEARYPGVRAHVLDGEGRVHRFVKLFVNGEPASLDTPVGEGDRIQILAAIAGG